MTDERFERAIAAIDAANAEDPRREAGEHGDEPKELLYSRRMSRWLERLDPDAGEALRLAARAQHLCRWRLERIGLPRRPAGLPALAARVRRAPCAPRRRDPRRGRLRRCDHRAGRRSGAQEGLPHDPEALALEDTACLVFLEHELAAFAPKHDEPKLVQILERTWRKMSPRGRAAALALELPPSARELIEKAIAGAVR